MAAHFRHLLENVRQGEPGHRFQDRYERAVRSRGRTKPWQRILKIVAAVVAIAIGLLEVLFPGPAILFFAIGGALLATESRGVARGMDWAEVKLRRAVHGAKLAWRHAATGQRAAVITTAAVVAVAGAVVAYRVITG